MNILNSDFIILNKSMLFISNIDNLVSNIPRSDYFYKDKIITCSYNLIEYIFRANYSNDKSIKDICLREILVNISLKSIVLCQHSEQILKYLFFYR